VPNYVSKEVKKHDFPLVEGLVLAIEPMVNMGRADTTTLGDHWTVVTRDGLPSAHVEHTLAITSEGIVVVTADWEPPPVPRSPPNQERPAGGPSNEENPAGESVIPPSS
jgi:methionyl aminopeptidase